MILVDTSAWVEFLRDTGSPVCVKVDDLIGDELATCDPIRMEVLAGARDDRHLSDLRGLLAGATLLSTRSQDYEAAAAIYRGCRREGETVRKLIDCVIAATAIRHGIRVLHADADFHTIARHTDLQIVAP